MSNPIFGRVEKDARSGYAGFGGRGRSVPQPAPAQQSYGQLGAPTYPQPTYPVSYTHLTLPTNREV